MAPLIRIPILLALAALCLQNGTAVPLKHSKTVEKVGDSAAISGTPTSPETNSTSPAVTLAALEAFYPPGGGPSITNVPLSEADLKAAVGGAVPSIETALPDGSVEAALSHALDTLQVAQSELTGVLGTHVPSLPGSDSVATSPASDAVPTSVPTSVPGADALSAPINESIPPSTEILPSGTTASAETLPPTDPSSTVLPSEIPPPTDPSTTLPAEPPVVTEAPKTINVTIGDGATRFTPAYVKANPGDTIMFNWVGKNNHSVTETDVLGSCNKSLAEGAFDSEIQMPGTTWSLLLPSNARGLKFFYCKVAKHCEAGGMSGTIIVPE